MLVGLVYAVHCWKPEWKLEMKCNPVVIMYGATLFPVVQTTNLITSAVLSVFFMGDMLRYHGVWFRKHNYLLGVGLDCGSQIMQTVMMLGINLPNVVMPQWWGNSVSIPDFCISVSLAGLDFANCFMKSPYLDRCFPPVHLPPHALG